MCFADITQRFTKGRPMVDAVLRWIQVGRRRLRLPRTHITLVWLAAASAAILVVATLGSPFAMAAIARRNATVDWSRLGDISTTFGAASALLSGLAVGGVALSVLMQTHQLRVGQIQAMRSTQIELMRMLIDDPILATVSPKSSDVPYEQWRKEIYLNLLFKYLEMGFATGYVGRAGVRSHLKEQFEVDTAKLYWARARDLWRENASTHDRRLFFEIVEEQFAAATARPPLERATPPPPPEPAPTPPSRPGGRTLMTGAGGAVALFATGVLVGALARRRDIRRRSG